MSDPKQGSTAQPGKTDGRDQSSDGGRSASNGQVPREAGDDEQTAPYPIVREARHHPQPWEAPAGDPDMKH